VKTWAWLAIASMETGRTEEAKQALRQVSESSARPGSAIDAYTLSELLER